MSEASGVTGSVRASGVLASRRGNRLMTPQGTKRASSEMSGTAKHYRNQGLFKEPKFLNRGIPGGTNSVGQRRGTQV